MREPDDTFNCIRTNVMTGRKIGAAKVHGKNERK